MSEKVVVRYAEDVCCPHCLKLFPLADGLMVPPMMVRSEGLQEAAGASAQYGSSRKWSKSTKGEGREDADNQ